MCCFYSQPTLLAKNRNQIPLTVLHPHSWSFGGLAQLKLPWLVGIAIIVIIVSTVTIVIIVIIVIMVILQVSKCVLAISPSIADELFICIGYIPMASLFWVILFPLFYGIYIVGKILLSQQQWHINGWLYVLSRSIPLVSPPSQFFLAIFHKLSSKQVTGRIFVTSPHILFTAEQYFITTSAELRTTMW